MSTPAATATLSDSTRPAPPMATIASHWARTRSPRPSRSLPSTRMAGRSNAKPDGARVLRARPRPRRARRAGAVARACRRGRSCEREGGAPRLPRRRARPWTRGRGAALERRTARPPDRRTRRSGGSLRRCTGCARDRARPRRPASARARPRARAPIPSAAGGSRRRGLRGATTPRVGRAHPPTPRRKERPGSQPTAQAR